MADAILGDLPWQAVLKLLCTTERTAPVARGATNNGADDTPWSMARDDACGVIRHQTTLAGAVLKQREFRAPAVARGRTEGQS